MERRHAIQHVERPASESPPCTRIAPWPPSAGNHHIGGDAERTVLDVEERVLRHSGHALRQRQRRPARHQVRSAGQRGDRALKRPVIHGKNEVRDRLRRNRSCNSASFSGSCAARSLTRLKSVRVSYSSHLPSAMDVLGCELPGRVVDHAREPAVVIDRAVAEHLEILRLVRSGRCGILDGVEHADPVHRPLRRAVHRSWARAIRSPREWSARRRSHG